MPASALTPAAQQAAGRVGRTRAQPLGSGSIRGAVLRSGQLAARPAGAVPEPAWTLLAGLGSRDQSRSSFSAQSCVSGSRRWLRSLYDE